MGGRGTFGVKDNKLNREDIITSLAKQGVEIGINGKRVTKETLKNLSNSDLSVIKDFIGKPGAKNIIVNLSSNFKQGDVRVPIKQQALTNKKTGKSKTVIQIDRNSYSKRGVKHFQKFMKEVGYEKGIKSVPIKKYKKATK